ncbi:endolytic transglycosylase MltG [Mucilaginibacter sp. 21P]|uniref:endolytic transglycosylase MltG n=1 Tax=Mucilaginibacter sp. 21P TaxID=2778902 RepID=UPI001C57C8E6|nr:endolytic transglycosylase MltG [Mucilaginibacter sp. 21P]QXV64832.1 endolytic transglycosylase MltG [Mucilaginibacter sp. 21P]
MKKFWIALIIIVVLSLIGTGVFYYLRFFGPNVTGNQKYLYIKTGSNIDDVYKTVVKEGIVNDTTSFLQAAHSMKYRNVKPGKYRLKEGMSNRNLINMLKAGNQEPVNFSFHNFRLKEQFAAYVGKNLEPDSAAMMQLLDSAKFAQQYGLTTDNIYTVFIPNTYQIYWNTTPEKLFKRLYANYEKFWTPERKQKAAAINLSPQEVYTLASIVDSEALFDSEMPTIAGLYLNRLRKGQKLESDPTVIFALKDFTIKRVLKRDLLTNSPYNTYLYKGLPPGPIMMPSIAAIDAVLNYEHNDYIYMVAKEDFSGHHNFAKDEAGHRENARKYHEALNERNIKR